MTKKVSGEGEGLQVLEACEEGLQVGVPGAILQERLSAKIRERRNGVGGRDEW